MRSFNAPCEKFRFEFESVLRIGTLITQILSETQIFADFFNEGFILNTMIMNEIKYRTGTLTKPTSQMSPTEYKAWQEEGNKQIREYFFSINQPLVYYMERIPVAEYKDGRIEKLK